MGQETYGREDFLGPWAQGLIWAIALPGLLLLAYGLVQIYRDFDLLIAGERTKGIVVKYETRTTNRGLSYRPVVRFRISRAESYTFTSNRGFSEKPYDRRETVTVLYKPEAPQDARVLGMLILSLGGSILIYTLVAVPPVLPVVGYYGFGAGSLLWKRRLSAERAPALGPD